MNWINSTNEKERVMEMQRGKKLRKFLSKKGMRTVAALMVCMLALQLPMADKVMAETEGAQDTEEAVEEITLMYIDANGEFAQKTVQKAFSELSEADLPECPDGVQFTEWVFDNLYDQKAYAEYEGKTILKFPVVQWFGESGRNELYAYALWIDTDIVDEMLNDGADDDLYRMIDDMMSERFGIPMLYPGLRFAGWRYSSYGNGNGYYIFMIALYWNTYATLNYGELSLPDKIVVGEEGTKVILPTECEGYTDLVWQIVDYDTGKNITVTELTLGEKKGHLGQMLNETVTCVGYTPSADGKDQEPVLIPPVESEPTPEPKPTPGPAELPTEIITEKTEEIEKAEDGAVIEITMDGATVVSKELLETIKNKNVWLRLNMGGYFWIINGRDISTADLKNINLEVVLDVNTVPDSLISSIAGRNRTRQIELTYNGEFGFTATLNLNLGAENRGRNASLYYYNRDGKLIFDQRASIGADGSVGLRFSHASNYVVVIERETAASSDAQKEQTNGNGQNMQQEKTTAGTVSPRTGENLNVAVLLFITCLMLTGLGVMQMQGRSRNTKK